MTTIITKNNATASAVPAAGALVQGELAVNVTDKKVYTKDSTATVVKLVGSLGNQEANAVAITGGTESGVAITGSTINNTPIGAVTPSTVTGTVVTATTGFSGPLTGAVTGNTTGTHTGAVVGDVTGNVTGNVTAATGSSSFNNVTINGTLDMNAGTSSTITGLATPVNTTDAATKGYVDTSVAAVVATAPAALDTLNELAAALGNDANFATTVTNSIATKLPLAGGTMTGAIAMSTNKITGLGTPTAGTDAATKTYVDTADALKLNLTGGTLTGNLDVGVNKVTSSAPPSTGNDLTNKTYVDSILGSATSAAASASAAATSATNAANSATSASTSSTDALSYLNAFKGQYYGSLASDPTLDPLGNAIGTGDLYWNTTVPEMRVYNGTVWVAAYLPAAGYLAKANNLSDLTNTATARTNLGLAIGTNVQAYNANTAVTNTAQTFSATQTFSGTSSTFGTSLLDANETVNVVAAAPSATTNFYIQSGSVQYYTSNAANNWTLNIAFSSGTSLNTALATGQSVTFTLITTQGSTAYYANAITIDGTSVTPKWIGGAPTAGNASGLDVYRFAVVKTASATYTVLASLTQYK